MPPNPGFLDLTSASVLVPPGLSGPEAKAVQMLVEEVERRSGVRWPVAHAWPESGAVIRIAPLSTAAEVDGLPVLPEPVETPPGPEGYHLRSGPLGTQSLVEILGSDSRGVLFGVGGLLRKLRMARGGVRLPAGLRISTAPRTPLRGHQLGYRPKTNSYDGWSLPMWEQYYRDLAVFGANAVELIPPRSDDDADSPHFPLPPMEMMEGMSRVAAEYGLDVWVWYPAMDEEYADPATLEAAVAEWAEVFRRLPRIDAVFVPGGDPGHTPPEALMALLARQAASLREHHPGAGMWVSPQGFTAEWMERFLRLLREEPAWLTGVVFAPQSRISLSDLCRAVPERYPIRHYPDITHTLKCQYPVPDWDVAFALTEGREPINPRPRAMARLFRATDGDTCGFLTYSEGCNDDVNKAVWSALGWDPEADLVEVLREYGRYFIGEWCADAFAHGLLALERNWEGSLLANAGVTATLKQFQALERAASPGDRLNWRFQQALYRAYYDAFVRSRLLWETGLQERAEECLRAAPRTGSLPALTEAERLLNQAVPAPPAGDWRARVFELAEALFQSVRMQLSVPRYAAIALGRGANLDAIDTPLNDRRWLLRRFGEIRALEGEAERLREIEALLAWDDPGPGGFYDEPGNPARRPHVLTGPGATEDPAFFCSLLTGFSTPGEERLAWTRHGETLRETPLRMRYTGLDSEAGYRLRVLYGRERTPGKIRLDAGEGVEVHPWIEKPAGGEPLVFPIPPEAYSTGALDLMWRQEPGRGGNGRGCQVCQVWLIREPGE